MACLPIILILSIGLALPASAAKQKQATSAQPEPGTVNDAAADTAFFDAKKAYSSLKKDEKRRRLRDRWMNVGAKFEAIADRFPNSTRAPQALFDAADLYSELSRVSVAKRDLRQAVETYSRLCEKYPKSSLADDAHYALALIYRDRKGDTHMAENEFRAALACKGDMQAKAKAAIAQLAPYRNETPYSVKPEKQEKVEKPENSRSEISRKDKEKDSNEREHSARPDRAEDHSARGRQKAELVAREDDDDEDESEVQSAPSQPNQRRDLDPNKLKMLKQAAKGELPLSVQMGLKIHRIILDPGHGGYDTGAIGPGGAREKEITLAIAKKLKARLESEGFEVVMTRDSDRFVGLDDRARTGNRRRGDLFLSIHCNAHKIASLRGVETYTLNVTDDQYAIRLAARENASSARALSDLQFVLADLAAKANTADSVKLARVVQSNLVESEAAGNGKGRTRDLGIKQALFYVLLGAKMPSILVETAFISNPEDEKRLKDPKRQEAMAQAIARGLKQFVSERDNLSGAVIARHSPLAETGFEDRDWAP